MLDRQQMRQLKIEPPDQAVYKEVLGNWDALAKPLDGMGEFEELFARIGAIRRDPALDISRKAVVVKCADNGIVEEKISQSGQDVTAKVAAAMGRGTSSVCRMAKAAGVEVIPVDIGINEEGSPEGVLPCKVRRGTRNFIKERAMTEQETLAAIEIGMELAKRLAHEGYKLLATGEMGIGNTTTSSAVAAALYPAIRRRSPEREPDSVTRRFYARLRWSKRESRCTNSIRRTHSMCCAQWADWISPDFPACLSAVPWHMCRWLLTESSVRWLRLRRSG